LDIRESIDAVGWWIRCAYRANNLVGHLPERVLPGFQG
jgi:hypothetical protein